MSFTLTPGETTITGINWWGGCYPPVGGTCDPATKFEIEILSDSSGTPGIPLDVAPVVSGNQTLTGKLIGGSSGWDEYAYSASVGPWTNLSANTTYWLDILETSHEFGDSTTWGWETTSSAPPGATLEQQNSDTGVWTSLPEQLAFQIIGSPTPTVPEPGFFGLVGGALGALALLRRRATR